MRLTGKLSVLRISLVFASAFALALLPGFAAEPTAPLVYYFPNVAGLGTLETVLPIKSLVGLDRLSSNKRKLADAVGTVKLPRLKEQLVYFRPGNALIRKPQLLDDISPENICHFRFNFTSACDAEDSIPDNLVSRISHLKNLMTIGLNNCDVTDTGVKGIHDMPKLQSVDLGHSLVTAKSLPVFSKLSGLRSLALDGLDMSGGDFNQIARLPKLSLLRLHGTQVRDSQIAALKVAKGLTVLDLSANPGITDASLVTVAALPELNYLDVSNTSVSVPALKKFPKINRIIVAERDLKGVSLKQMQKVIKNIDLNADLVQNSKVIKPGADELHLFAPTHF